MNRFTPYLIFLCLSLCIGFGSVFIQILFPYNLSLITRFGVLLLFFCVSSLSHFILEGKIKDKAAGFVRAAMLMQTLKLLILALGLIIGAFYFKGKATTYILFYAITYVVFLIGEQVLMAYALKQKTQN
jgi:hypothetical protein